MLVTKTVPVKITKCNLKKYQDLGYQNVELGLLINVKIEDMNMSNRKIATKCDYCGSETYTTIADYNRRSKKQIIQKDSCKKCSILKQQETIHEKYGVNHIININGSIEKRSKNYLEKHYINSPMQLPEVIEKRRQNSLIKYGCENPMQNKMVHNKVEATNILKYGFPNPMQNKEIKAKAIKTLYKEGKTPTSKQQLKLFEIIKSTYGECVDLNYPVDNLSIDIALFLCDKKIAIEYDGWYWHRDQQKDIKKSYVLTNNKGWNVIRVRSGHLLPTKEQLISVIENVTKNNKKFQTITLDDWVDY